jgi:hypothetical protein
MYVTEKKANAQLLLAVFAAVATGTPFRPHALVPQAPLSEWLTVISQLPGPLPHPHTLLQVPGHGGGG